MVIIIREYMKIIQIAVSSGDGEIPDIVYALTEDGKIYAMSTGSEKWRKVPEIPNDLI